jgi:hypothetical protein
MAGSDGNTAKANGAGTPSDALAAFAAQAVKIPAGPTPDANVAVAYALGWAVSDALIWTECGTTRHLEYLEQLPDELRQGARPWEILINQITSRCKKLDAHLKDAGADPDLSDPLKICEGLHLGASDPADSNRAVGGKRTSVQGLHTGILTVLWSVEQSLGKAYLLGHEMEQMCATPAAKGTGVTVSFFDTRFGRIHPLLLALASKLPPNAAHATDNSLRLWQASLNAGCPEDSTDLLKQGRYWREVLAGDVAGKDGLRLEDYIAAADSVTDKLRKTALQVARRFAVWLITAFVVAAGGIGLIWVGSRGAVGTGIAGLVAAFGLTWKGIGEFFGRAAAVGEAQLWDAELDWAIAHRFTVLTNLPDKKHLKKVAALKDDQPMKEHMLRQQQWKSKWPGVRHPEIATTPEHTGQAATDAPSF